MQLLARLGTGMALASVAGVVLVGQASAGPTDCTGVIATNQNQDFRVPDNQTCIVDADVNGNFYVEGNLVVLPGRTIKGNIEFSTNTDPVANIQSSTIMGNIVGKEKAQVELSGATVKGDVTFEKSTSGLELSNGPSLITGNLEFKATTNVSGAGNLHINGNAKCNNNVNDAHLGVITTNGNKEGCPPTF